MANRVVEAGDDFLTQVETARTRVKEKFRQAKALLQERENALLLELDEMKDEYLQHHQKDMKHRDELLATREHLQNTLKGNDNKATLQAMLAPLEARLAELAGLEDKIIEFDWSREEELTDMLKEFGFIRTTHMNINANKENKLVVKEKPVLVACKYKENTTILGQFKWATVIAVHPNTNLYILDPLNNRVQVFNKSCKFLFCFSDSMNHPAGICFHRDQVYVTQNQSEVLNVYTTNGEFVRTVGGKGSKNPQFKSPVRLCNCELTGYVYVCEQENRVQVLDANLSFNSYILKLVSPREVKTTKDDIFILDKQNPCLHVYNHKHELIRNFISFGNKTCQISDSFHFFIADNSSILFTDYVACCVLVFSKEGNLLHKFGRRGEKKGEFIKPRGIAIDSLGRIVVASNNPDHCIQFF